MIWQARYKQAHERDFAQRYPQAYASGHYFTPTIPDVKTSNGLTQYVLKFLTFMGHRATRISSAGRLIKSAERQASGTTLLVSKFITSTTRKGSADVSSTINGRSVMWEIKIGKDKPSEYQLREQEIERRAGGEYFFVKTAEEFLEAYDQLIL